MLLIDDYSKMSWITFLNKNLETLYRFKVFKSMVENQIEAKIKCLRFDRGGEFTPNGFDIFCEEHDIRRQLSALGAP